MPAGAWERSAWEFSVLACPSLFALRGPCMILHACPCVANSNSSRSPLPLPLSSRASALDGIAFRHADEPAAGRGGGAATTGGDKLAEILAKKKAARAAAAGSQS